MMDIKAILGFLTIIIGIVSYSIYCRSIFQRRIKPDAFSWFTWGTLAGVTFLAQFKSNAGPGMWATAFTAFMCIFIGFLAFFYGYRKLSTIDSISLVGALVGLALWKFTENPLLAVVCVISVGALGFVPTFYKAYKKPKEEGVLTFALNAVKFGVALFAIQAFIPVNYLYPFAMVILNVSLACTIYIRSRKVGGIA